MSIIKVLILILIIMNKYIKAIGGGSGVKKTCEAYFVELIAVVSTLLTECQNSTQFQRLTNSIFGKLFVTRGKLF